jgi:hypothetical protein
MAELNSPTMPIMARMIVDSVIIDNLFVVVLIDHLITSTACRCNPAEVIYMRYMSTWAHDVLAIAPSSCVTSDWFGVHH